MRKREIKTVNKNNSSHADYPVRSTSVLASRLADEPKDKPNEPTS